jgi:hypothetical protein
MHFDIGRGWVWVFAGRAIHHVVQSRLARRR